MLNNESEELSMENITLEGYIDFCEELQIVHESFLSNISPEKIWETIKKWFAAVCRTLQIFAYNFKRLQSSKLPKKKYDALNMVYSHWSKLAATIDMSVFKNKLPSVVFEGDALSDKTETLEDGIDNIKYSNEYDMAMSPSLKNDKSNLVRLTNKNELVSALIKASKNLEKVADAGEFFASIKDDSIDKAPVLEYFKAIQSCYNLGIEIIEEFWETAKNYNKDGDSVEELDTPIQVNFDEDSFKL